MTVSATVVVADKEVTPINESGFIYGGDDEKFKVNEVMQDFFRNGENYIQGRIVGEREVHRQTIEIKGQEEKTESPFALRSSPEGELDIFETDTSQPSSDDLKLTETKMIEAYTTEYILVRNKIFLLFDEVNDKDIHTIEHAYKIDVKRVNFDIHEIIQKFENKDALIDCTQMSYEAVDENTTSATITGDLANNQINKNISKSGSLKWCILDISHDERELKIGLSRNGKLVLYGSINIPRRILGEVITEFELI